jgi:hypothetical protein
VLAFLATRSLGVAIVAASLVAALWTVVVVVLLRAEPPDPNSRLGRFDTAMTEAAGGMPAPVRTPAQERRRGRLLWARVVVLVVGAVAMVTWLWIGLR